MRYKRSLASFPVVPRACLAPVKSYLYRELPSRQKKRLGWDPEQPYRIQYDLCWPVWSCNGGGICPCSNIPYCFFRHVSRARNMHHVTLYIFLFLFYCWNSKICWNEAEQDRSVEWHDHFLPTIPTKKQQQKRLTTTTHIGKITEEEPIHFWLTNQREYHYS